MPSSKTLTTNELAGRRQRGQRLFYILTLLYPLILSIAASVYFFILLPQLPASIAIHWDGAGQANGWGSPWLVFGITVAFALGLPALIALSGRSSIKNVGVSSSIRFMAAIAVGLSTLMVLVLVVTLLIANAGDETLPMTWGLVYLAVSVLAGFVAWLVQPSIPNSENTGETVAPLELQRGERVVWIRTVQMSKWPRIFLYVLSFGFVLLTIALWILGAEIILVIILGATTVLILGATLVATKFTVRIDASGLRVISSAGWPSFRVPIAAVKSVSVIKVAALSEFGGFGFRSVPGGFGVIVSSGEALRVERKNGRFFVVTVPDAATGAAVLEAYQAR